jgi:hypothetical protein
MHRIGTSSRRSFARNFKLLPLSVQTVLTAGRRGALSGHFRKRQDRLLAVAVRIGITGIVLAAIRGHAGQVLQVVIRNRSTFSDVAK